MLTKLLKVLNSPVYRIKRHLNMVLYPRYINYICTYKCNSRCNMCGIWKRQEKEEMPWQEFLEFLGRNRGFLVKTKHIGLTGGEPTLKEGLVEIIRGIRELGKETGFQTNGLEPEKIRKIVKEILTFYPRFSISVSLDGMCDTHNKMRGLDDAYDRAIHTIKYMQEMNVPRTIGMTITKDNYKEIGNVRAIAEITGSVFSCCPAERSWYFNNEDSDLRQVNIDIMPHSYYMNNIGKDRKFTCYGGWTTLTIDPYGDVYPCILRALTFGNIRKDRLSAMLYSFWGGEVKKEVKKCKGCWSQCEVTTSADVDCLDVLKWFIFNCKDKERFLNELKK